MMQIEETSAEGLSRELKITVAKDNLASRLDTKLLELKDQVQLKGFRKGKVPVAHLKKVYGSRLMSEILQEVVNDQSQQVLTDRDERPALKPEVNLDGDIENVISGDADFVFNMIYDIIPPIKLAKFKDISLDRKVAEISDTEVDESIQRLAQSRKQFEPKAKTAKAASGDSVKIDFLGKIDDEPFEGGAAEGFEFELGSNQFIPGFEDQIIGKKAGDSFDIEVNFPEDYGNADLANKAAVFETTVHEVSGPKEIEINDEFATSMGMESLDQLKEMVREQIGKDYHNFSREQVKRDLLDKLSDAHDFELPTRMVDLEFNQIWHQFESELENQSKKIDELDETEDELRTEYREI
ncbi:MAG: trigger factor, partial [Candidatus Micropelagos sp.]|nr:trigger factor [Candidatus Micropelagos sp.]